MSHREIVISFRPGDDGGLEQTVTCEYAREDSASFTSSVSQQYPVGSHETDEFVVSRDLAANTIYVIRLASNNSFQTGEAAVSDVLVVQTRGTCQPYFRNIHVEKPMYMYSELHDMTYIVGLNSLS